MNLGEIRKRAGAATLGPWRVVLDDSERATTVWRQCDSPAHPLADDPDRLGVYDDCCYDGGVHSEPFYTEADAEFVAHARQDIPALLAEIDRLNARYAELLAAGRAWLAEVGPLAGANAEHRLADAIEARLGEES